tara:strand:- start:66 stop:329 length:264 start_codon:yes stop_codon:yes gene_type:complete
MDDEGGVKTLINRQETHGRKFPGLIEKLGFVLAIALTILIGQWMWSESGWSTLVLWPVTVCGLPLGALLLGEMLARITQKVHVNGEN